MILQYRNFSFFLVVFYLLKVMKFIMFVVLNWVFAIPIFANPKILQKGDKVPDFSMLLDNGKTTNFYSFLNKGNTIVLYFYPKDGTSGCTAQAINIKNNLDKLIQKNVVVFGISTDDLLSHQNFKKEHNLNFFLVSDYDKSISKLFNVLSFFGVSQRITFIIDSSGIIQDIIKDVKVNQHTEQILSILENKNKSL
ncbi:MAG: peroxiredoxin [Leptonema sp. (in: bacteria)]